jgi:hypothetical protein
VDLGDITILSPRDFDESCASALPPHLQRDIELLTPQGASDWPLRKTTFARIEDFKGMENQFIALVDVAALAATSRDLSLIYIGMSRARTGLWMAIDSRLEPELLILSERNLVLLEEAEAELNAHV